MPNKEIIEATVADGVSTILKSQKGELAPSAFTCPDCGGALWEIENGNLVRYRCHVGHVYTADSLLIEKDSVLENVLWSALRALEESVAMRHRMAARARQGRISSIAENFERRAHEDEARAELLRQFLLPQQEKGERSLKRQPRSRTANKASEKQKSKGRTPKGSKNP